jgi:hypothetical protein
MDIEAWFRDSAIDNKNAFFQYRVWELVGDPTFALEAVRSVLEDSDNFCFGRDGETLFDAGGVECASATASQDADVAEIIDSMVQQLNLERAVSRICTLVRAPHRNLLVVVIHHLLVDSLSWEYIEQLVEASIRSASAERQHGEQERRATP